jgi:hypothetical protein
MVVELVAAVRCGLAGALLADSGRILGSDGLPRAYIYTL